MGGDAVRCPQIRGRSHPRMPRVGPIHTPKRLRRASVRLGFFRFAAVKEFTSMYGTDSTRYRSHNGKGGGMRKGSSNHLGSDPRVPSNEREASVPMPADVREAVVDLLAKILVADYQRFQGVTEPTVKLHTVSNRGLRLVKTGEKAV